MAAHRSPSAYLSTRLSARAWQRRIRWVPVHRIEPCNEVQKLDAFARIWRSMLKEGWKGRPLLVEPVVGGWLAWTGSHRIAAALAALVWDVPVVQIDVRRWWRVHGPPPRSALSETWSNECRLGWLEATGDVVAIELMRQEELYGYITRKGDLY